MYAWGFSLPRLLFGIQNITIKTRLSDDGESVPLQLMQFVFD